MTTDVVAEPNRAGFVSRASADVVDALLVSVVTALIVVVGAVMAALFTASSFAFPRPGTFAASGALSVAYLVYLAVFWATTGRTPGKHVAGLRVVTSRGEPLPVPRAVARALVCLVFPVGLLWILVSRRNLAVHDVLLRTAVIYDWRPRQRRTTLSPRESTPARAGAAERGSPVSLQGVRSRASL